MNMNVILSLWPLCSCLYTWEYNNYCGNTVVLMTSTPHWIVVGIAVSHSHNVHYITHDTVCRHFDTSWLACHFDMHATQLVHLKSDTVLSCLDMLAGSIIIIYFYCFYFYPKNVRLHWERVTWLESGYTLLHAITQFSEDSYITLTCKRDIMSQSLT